MAKQLVKIKWLLVSGSRRILVEAGLDDSSRERKVLQR